MNPVTVSVGHTVNCALVFLDQNGNPMLIQPTPDSPPTWTDTTPATGTLTTGPGGLTAAEAIIAAGTDTISVSATVAGVALAATVGIVANPAAQVVTSVEITTTVV